MRIHIMEICNVSVLYPAQPIRDGPRYFPSCKIRASPLRPSYGVVCNFKSETETLTPNRMFMLGMGFVSQYFAHQLKLQNWQVIGTCTSEVKQKKLKEIGFDSILFNASEPDLRSLNVLKESTHLLVSIPPIEGLGDPVLCLHRAFLQIELGNRKLQWMCYLSSTSVYGDCGGALVDEDYPISTTSEKAKARLAAEKAWLDLGHDLNVNTYIFRLGGIYGPGRSALDTILNKRTLSKGQKKRESRSRTSRVHVADICQALMASMMTSSSSRRIYNVVDDDPAPRAEVFAFAQAMIKERWSLQIKDCLSVDAVDMVSKKEETGAEKRVSNAHLKKDLEVKLLYPNYKSGLQSIADSMQNPYISSCNISSCKC